jgi:hypothetical protein
MTVQAAAVGCEQPSDDQDVKDPKDQVIGDPEGMRSTR